MPESERPVEPQLSLADREAIRRFLWRWFAAPGLLGAFAIFFAGFFVRDIAIQKATNDAFSAAQGTIMRLTEEVLQAKFEVTAATRDIRAATQEIRQSEEKAKQFAGKVSDLERQFKSTSAFQASDPQIKEIARVVSSQRSTYRR